MWDGERLRERLGVEEEGMGVCSTEARNFDGGKRDPGVRYAALEKR